MTGRPTPTAVPDLAGRRVLVCGAGVSGVSAASALVDLGAVVTVTDSSAGRLAGLSGVPGALTAVALSAPPPGTDLVVTSPGWRPDTPVLAAARESGIEVIGEVELAWRVDRARPEPARWLCVTGTNGKTTTVGMLESILTAAGRNAVACGNIGLPVIDAVRGGHTDLAVELSSFQLHWSPSVRPDVGVLLNLAEDHLDWHGDLNAYADAKARVLDGAVAVAGVDDPVVAGRLARCAAPVRVGVSLGEPVPGSLGVRDGTLVDHGGAALLHSGSVRPAGPSGVFDALAAAACARFAGVSVEDVAAGLRAFEPAAHRCVVIGEYGGVTYVDDSKATNPHAAMASLAAFPRVVWVAGGQLKGASVDGLVRANADRLVGVVLIGRDRGVIADSLARHAPDVPVTQVSRGHDEAMTEVVGVAGGMARPGDVVLLAPAAASWDMFDDYRHRGRAFEAAVRARAGADVHGNR